MRSLIGRVHPALAVLGGLVLVVLAVPLVAFVVVPQFVRSTVHEAAPTTVVSAPSVGARPGTASPTATPTSRVIATGSLRRINVNDFGTGTVLLLEAGGKRYVRFENVDISAAPVQHVYLSDRTDGQPGTFRDLGPLKATNGSFNYELPDGIDLGTVRSVVSYCRQFHVTITYAVLLPQ